MLSAPTLIQGEAGCVREVDALDLLLATSVIACLAPLSRTQVTRRQGTACAQVDEQGRWALHHAEDDENLVSAWLGSVVACLLAEVVDLVGGTWEAECEVGIEMILAERCVDLPALADASQQGPLIARDLAPAVLMGRRIPNGTLANLVA